jgi:putative sporulation protein YtxC
VGRLIRVAESVAACVVDVFEADLLARALRQRFGLFEASARASILARAGRHLDGSPAAAKTARSGRAGRIAPVLLDLIRDEGGVVLDGVLTFRLPGYLALLEEAVRQAVDEHLLEREYAEFIRVLRSFVAAQPTRTDRVHLVVEGAQVWLYDRDGRPLPLDRQPSVALESLEAAISYEDVLISALIAAAPTHIVVHRRRETPSNHVESVRRVFEARVERCKSRSCGLCAGA